MCSKSAPCLEKITFKWVAFKWVALKVICVVSIALALPHTSWATCQTKTQQETAEQSTSQSPPSKPAIDSELSISWVRSIGLTDRAHTDRIKNVRLINEATAISCAADGTVCLWDLESQQLVRRFVDEKAKTVYCVTLTPDHRFIIAGGDGKRIVRWDLESGELVQSYPCGSSVYSIGMCIDGDSFVAGDASGTVSRWKIEGEEPSSQYKVDGDDITALRCLPDGSGFVSGNGDGKVSVWNFDGKKPEHKFKGLGTWVCCLQISEDQNQLIGCDYGGDVALWDLQTKKQVWQKASIASEISWIRFLNDQQLVAVSGNNQLFSIDRDSGKSKKFDIDMPDLGGFDLAADGKSIFCGGKNSICGWDITGKRTYPDDDTYIQSQPVSDLVVHNNVAYSIGDQPKLVGRDLETGDIVFENDLKSLFKKKPSGVLNLIRTGERIVVVSSGSYVVVDLKRDNLMGGKSNSKLPNSKLQKCTLSGISISPNPMKLIGIDTKRQKILEFDPEKPKSNRELMKSNIEDSKLASLDDVFFVQYSEQSIGILSVDRGLPVQERALSDFGIEQIAADKGLIVATDGSKLIGFAAPKLTDTSTMPGHEVGQLVDQLSSQQFDSREKATLLLAGGGQVVLDQLDSLPVESIEAKSRLTRIRELIGNRGIPNLNQMATANLKGPFEALAVHPGGDFWLATARREWKSELFSGRIVNGQFKIDITMPLRSRASAIEFIEDGNQVIVGYADGSLDVMQVNPE